jgi:alkylation response protein AidB-like acyl-CoA dehydrogenase
MDVRLSPEQQALRDSAVQVVGHLAATAVGQLDNSERAAKLDAAVAAAGWRELRCPVEGGAPLASAVEAAIVAEELGRALADTAFLGPTLAAELRRLAGAPAATRPETVVLDAGLGDLARVGDGSDPASWLAVDAQGATAGLVLLPVEGGVRLGTVALDPVGEQVDLTRPNARLSTAPPVAPPSTAPPELLADQGRVLTDDDLLRWTALGLALTSADLVGVMRGAVQLACDYAVERRQYGAAIGSFQAVQHLLADAYVAMEGSRSVGLHAAWAVDALPAADALAAAAVAKAYAARAARTVCETTIQVHGGIGNTWECMAHVFLRRALLSSDVLGGAGTNLGRVLAHHGIGGDHGLR